MNETVKSPIGSFLLPTYDVNPSPEQLSLTPQNKQHTISGELLPIGETTMSDALTDIARDQMRGQLYDEYLEALRSFLKDSSETNRKKVVESAYKTDSIPRGYFESSTGLKKEVETRMDLLKQGDKEAWAKFLFSLRNPHDFKIFKNLSPFAGKLLVAVDYGCGFVNLYGDIQPIIDEIIRKGKGWKIYDADDYLVVMDKPDTKKAEVYWAGCGILGQKGPRETKSQD